jgi:hypothetical protein
MGDIFRPLVDQKFGLIKYRNRCATERTHGKFETPGTVLPIGASRAYAVALMCPIVIVVAYDHYRAGPFQGPDAPMLCV